MDSPAHDPRDEAIADLLGRLVEDGRNYARAEVDLLKRIARHRAGRARNGLIVVAAGAVFLLSSLTALLLGLVLGLAALIGPVLAGLAIAALLAGIGYLLIRSGAAGLRALGGDEEERQALLRGETMP
ncbi:phage holin family protein [Sphingosinicella sp. CPCC 101087]|uniref:phage holin family protein n=1 Tax=Sphingosinicella sp. CPCC 101087 TaxID=2497754 RepID=UPI00101DD789|nr:phage holin family protein [Sphingosinicella sp. CPCC 101087]